MCVYMIVCVCVCVCVRETGTDSMCVFVFICARSAQECVCVKWWICDPLSHSPFVLMLETGCFGHVHVEHFRSVR